MALSLKSCFATLPKTERARAIVLGGDPKGKNFLYSHGTNIIIRDIENPAVVDIYSEHSKETTVAKYSPSGFYIASGDITGKLRIWDTVNKEHILKNEFQPFAGRINDLSWDPESKKICAVGMGREKFGACITYDSGNTVGNITGHTKEVNSCAYKPTRPYRIATASEDQTVVFLEGPPFKYKNTHELHSNFVNCVRYSPSGDIFISAGSDGRAFVFDGKTGEHVGELGAPKAHAGGIYAVSFSPDSTQVLTVSGDKSAKLWDVSTMQCVTEFPMGKEVRDQQLGCLWQGPHMLTVSLSGYINYLDKNNPNQPIRIIKGFNKPISSVAVSQDRSRIYTGVSDGSISYFESATGNCEEIKGKGHSNQVQGMRMEGDLLTTIGLDDTIRITSAVSNEYGAGAVKLDSQPRGIGQRQKLTAVACYKHVTMMQDNNKLSSLPVSYEPQCADIHPDNTEVAVGGTNTIVIYTLSNGRLTEKKKMSIDNCNVCGIQYSPDGTVLAAAGSDKNVRGYDVTGNYQEAFTIEAHNARICDLEWSPDGAHIATCGIDNSIKVFLPAQSLNSRKASAKDVHPKSYPNKIQWISNNEIVSVGQDSGVRIWSF